MKTAIVTGASQRLGLYLTESLLKKDWQVFALTRSSSPALNALNCAQLDIVNVENYTRDSVAEAALHIQSKVERIDLLINNASIFVDDTVIAKDGSFDYSDLSFIHVEMPHLLMSKMHHLVAKAKGNIVSITDIFSDNPNPRFSLYCSTKAGLKSLTLSAAKRWAPDIRANCIQPGPIKFLPEHTEDQKTRVMSETLLPWEGGFDPIFKTIEFIVDNTYLTGQSINVDGGRSIVRG